MQNAAASPNTEKTMATTRRKQPTTIDNSRTISQCEFYGVRWDAKAVDAVQTIAEGLLRNAEGLCALAQVLKSQNVEIKSMIHIGGDSTSM